MRITNKDNVATISDEFPTITSWSVEGREILFPEKEILVAGKQKKRGGIPLCLPNFGKSVVYNYIEIPQHGFLRDTRNRLYRTHPENNFIAMAGRVCAYGLNYIMNIKMQVHHPSNMPTLTQTIYIISGESKVMMPLCLGFHPYFHINRKYMNFVRDGKAMDMTLFSDQSLLSAQAFDFKNTFEIQLDEKLSVEMTCRGDFETGYQKIYIWSDRPNTYICIKPVMHDQLLFGTEQGYFVGDKSKYFHISYTCKMG